MVPPLRVRRASVARPRNGNRPFGIDTDALSKRSSDQVCRRATTGAIGPACSEHAPVVDEVQGVDGLVDAANLGNRLRHASWPLVDLEGRHDAHGWHAAELEGADEADTLSQCGAMRSR